MGWGGDALAGLCFYFFILLKKLFFNLAVLGLCGLPGCLSGKRSHLLMQETWVRSLGREDPLKKEVATHSSILTRKIPGTGEPGELQSMGSQSWIQLRD